MDLTGPPDHPILASMSQLILVVEDDEVTAKLLKEVLEAERYLVTHAPTAFRARGILAKSTPALIVLDRRLPDLDGLELCREIRADPQWKQVPILFLTAKNSVIDRVTGLKLGGDDYLIKPFDPHELLARIEVLLRRFSSPEEPSQILEVGELKLDLSQMKVYLRGEALSLWAKEFELLKVLLEKKERVLSREFLLQTVWGYEKELQITSKTVDVTMSRLRKKLGTYGDKIVYVKGYGYRFEVSV